MFTLVKKRSGGEVHSVEGHLAELHSILSSVICMFTGACGIMKDLNILKFCHSQRFSRCSSASVRVANERLEMFTRDQPCSLESEEGFCMIPCY